MYYWDAVPDNLLYYPACHQDIMCYHSPDAGLHATAVGLFKMLNFNPNVLDDE